MTFKEKFEAEERWDMRCRIISVYHHTMKLKFPRWTIKDTAKYFSKSSSYISEDLKIADALLNHLEFNSRKHALANIPKNGNRT